MYYTPLQCVHIINNLQSLSPVWALFFYQSVHVCSSTAQCIKSYFHSQRTVILRLTERGDRDTRLELSQHSSAWLSAGVIFSLSMLLDF